jgi:hypothetical protein
MSDSNPHHPHEENQDVLISKNGIVERHPRLRAGDMVQHLGWRFEQTANLPPKE